MWTPVTLPPQFSSVQTLTPVAMKVLETVQHKIAYTTSHHEFFPSPVYSNTDVTNKFPRDFIKTRDHSEQDQITFDNIDDYTIDTDRKYKHQCLDFNPLDRVVKHSLDQNIFDADDIRLYDHSSLTTAVNQFLNRGHFDASVNQPLDHSLRASVIFCNKPVTKPSLSTRNPKINDIILNQEKTSVVETKILNSVQCQPSPDMELDNIDIYSFPYIETDIFKHTLLENKTCSTYNNAVLKPSSLVSQNKESMLDLNKDKAKSILKSGTKYYATPVEEPTNKKCVRDNKRDCTEDYYEIWRKDTNDYEDKLKPNTTSLFKLSSEVSDEDTNTIVLDIKQGSINMTSSEKQSGRTNKTTHEQMSDNENISTRVYTFPNNIQLENEKLKSCEDELAYSEPFESLFIQTQNSSVKISCDYDIVETKAKSGDLNILPGEVCKNSDILCDYQAEHLCSFNDNYQTKPINNVSKSKKLELNKNLSQQKPLINCEDNTTFQIKNCCRTDFESNTNVLSTQLTSTSQQNVVGPNNSKGSSNKSYMNSKLLGQEVNPIKTPVYQNTKQSKLEFSKVVSYNAKDRNDYDKNLVEFIRISSKDKVNLQKYEPGFKKLKQSTLFDCKLFHTGEQLSNFEQRNQHNHNTVNTSKCNRFKKPQLPVKNFSIRNKMSMIKNQLKYITVDHFSCKQYNKNKSSKIQKSTTHTKAAKLLLQSNHIKSECMKTQWSTKMPCFAAPLLTPQATYQKNCQRNFTITVLDEISGKEILGRPPPDRVIMTIIFKEGYTLLNKPVSLKKNDRSVPTGLMFLVHWGSLNEYYFLELQNVDYKGQNNMLSVIDILLKQTVCFEAQAVFTLLIDVFHCQNIVEWKAFDPLVGCWLLDSDNPPTDFQETLIKLDMDIKMLITYPNANPKTQACELLPVLSVAADILHKHLNNLQLWILFDEMEMKIVPLLAMMECSSIIVDVQKLHETAIILNKILNQLQKKADSLVGQHIQINSHLQLRNILFEKLKLHTKVNVTVKETEHGFKSTSETVLSQLKNFHPLPNIILEYRRLQKIKSTYVEGIIQYVKTNGTVSTSWDLIGAATGRITSKNPNLQSIPKAPVTLQNGEVVELRAIFRAREGHSFLAADFQQIEFRVFAHFTEDPKLMQVFQDGGDIFGHLAQSWLGSTGKKEREKTKRIVYAVMYGAGPSSLADYLHVNTTESARIITNFVEIFPCLRNLSRSVVAQCRAQGYITTLSGRRRLFPHIQSTNSRLRSYSERQAINFLIQGSAADICKAAMLDCNAALKAQGLDALLLLQIHDELIWEVPDSQLHDTARTVCSAIENKWGQRLALKVPVPVSISSGKTLADMVQL